MVREERGPYGDPQHPYFYEEEDVWMAPGFINQFYEVRLAKFNFAYIAHLILCKKMRHVHDSMAGP